MSPVGGVTSLEDDYHQAVAANLVQELLYQNKRHREEERAAPGGKTGTGTGTGRTGSGRQRRSSTARDKVGDWVGCLWWVTGWSVCGG